jgi:hypothetical protein
MTTYLQCISAIDETERIGDSLDKINGNFLCLDSAVESLSGSVDIQINNLQTQVTTLSGDFNNLSTFVSMNSSKWLSVISVFNAYQEFSGINMPRNGYDIKFTTGDQIMTSASATYDSGTGRVTILEDGWYELHGSVRFGLGSYADKNNNLTWDIRLRKNGFDASMGYSSIQDHSSSGGGDTFVTVKANAGNTFNLVFFHEINSTFPLNYGALSIKKIADF